MHTIQRLRGPIAACALLSASPLLAQSSLDFPLNVTSADGLLGTVEMVPDAVDLAALTELDAVLFEDVVLPGGFSADLDLTRVAFDGSEIGIHLDGAAVPGGFHGVDQSMWKGSVPGWAYSDVFLSFSSFGCHGWIDDGVDKIHLMSNMQPGADWSTAVIRFVPQSTLNATVGAKPFACLADSLERKVALDPVPIGTAALGGPGSTLEVKWGIETDFQLTQAFGVQGAQNYIASLLGAIRDRYLTQVDLYFNYPYVAFYSTNNDPWSVPDNGGSTFDSLFELKGHYEFNLPPNTDAMMLISYGVSGGGVAWVDVLCNDEYSFGMIGNINGNLTFPVTQGSNTWDFVATSHEMGHIVGTLHTHDYCPPLDECAPSGYFGQCQSQANCTSSGTIMSYCHLCSGGMNNVTTFFHPQVVAQMRQEAENASCIGPYANQPSSFCQTTPNSVGSGALMGFSGSNSITSNDLVLVATGSIPGQFGLFYYGPNQVSTPFGDGLRCVGGQTVRFPVLNMSASGVASLAVDYSSVHAMAGPLSAGSVFQFQLWYRDPAAGGTGFNLSDGLSIPFTL